jgi:alpha-glucosidase
MQWDGSKNAGFSTAAKTWLWIPKSAATYNVEVESKDPRSILNWYKRLITLRRTNPALRDGNYITVNADDPNVLSFVRKASSKTVLVALNMSAKAQTLSYEVGKTAVVLLANPPAKGSTVDLKRVVVPAFGVVVAEVK